VPLSEWPPHAEPETGQELPAIVAPPPGPRSRAAAARLAEVECPAFGHRRERRAVASGAEQDPIVLSHGRGANLYDVDGNRYVDLVAGFGSVLLGHGAPSVAHALEAQGARLLQGLGDVYASDAKLALLERLVSLGPGEHPMALLAQNGGDAVSAAIKTAVLATGRAGLVAFEGAYHGLGHGPLAACGLRASYRAPFAAQLGEHVTFAPYPRSDAELAASLALVQKAFETRSIGAILVEPILGRGGVVVPPAGFLQGLCDLAHAHGALVIADEIWTGLGRSGALVRTLADGVPVDVVCLGKGLGGGLSISACLAPEAVMRAWARDEEVVHTSTHAGSPLACAAALTTLHAVHFRKLDERAAAVGARALGTFSEVLRGAPGFVAARGAGLMLGIELASGALALAASRALLGRGFLVLGGGLGGEVLTLTPPLTIAEELLESAAHALREVLSA
jgi:4-aminobutyrate aminotransferase/(S)-3-amino-2-methylpropionate transaminase